MRIQISLAADEKPATDVVAPAPQAFGSAYDRWLAKVSAAKNFKEVKRLDNNKMVALDTAGNTIETFVIETERKNLKVDTLDAKQTGTPADKTAQDVRVDPKVEKGA
jgi:hypothetical protein